MGEVYGVPKLWHKGKSGDFYIMVRLAEPPDPPVCSQRPLTLGRALRLPCHVLLYLAHSAMYITLLPLLSCRLSSPQLPWAHCLIQRGCLGTSNVVKVLVWECTSRLQPGPGACR